MRVAPFLLLPAALLVTACGGGASGGGGGVSSTPSPPQAAKNATMDNLVASQTFASDAGVNDLSFDLSNDTTASAADAPDDLSIRYDAASKSYVVTAAGKSQTFDPASVSETNANEVRYKITENGDNSYLTIVKVPYSAASSNKYVRTAYLQRNHITGSQQDTLFSTFTFGLDTPPGGVPRSGTAGYAIDVFGLESKPGDEPRTFQGEGQFSVDFGAGLFSVTSTLTETGFLTGAGVYGGGIELLAGGYLSSSDGSFSGDALYGGMNGPIGGTITGSFYGPTAQEVGASFSGSGANGTFTGSFTGTLDGSATVQDFTLTNLTSEQTFPGLGAELEVMRSDGIAGIWPSTNFGGGNVQYRGPDDYTVVPPGSSIAPIMVTPADRVASPDPDYNAYHTTWDGNDVTVLLAKTGSENTTLALTYASFGSLATSYRSGVNTYDYTNYFTYGLPTPHNLLLGQTGKAHYGGILIGGGANRNTGDTYDLNGTSTFDIDFASQTLSAALSVYGTGTNGTASLDFGSYDFAGDLNLLNDTRITSMIGPDETGHLDLRFYGPTGEEIAGPFFITVLPGNIGAGTYLTGVFAAKRD